MLQQFGIIAGALLIGGDHQPARVGHAGGAFLPQAGVGGAQHRGNPVAGRVQRGTPGACGVLGAQRLAEARGVFLARTVAPVRLAGVREEHHRPHHAVGERLGVTVGMVGARTREPTLVGFIGDERDLTVVAAERGTGQRESSGGIAISLGGRVTPGLGVARMVDLIENHQGLAVLGAHPMPGRMRGDLRVGDHDTVVVAGGAARRVGESRIQRDADPVRGLRPLMLQVLGRRDDGDLVDGAVGEQLCGDPQCEGGLTRAGGGHREKVPRLGRQIFRQCATLPRTQRTT